MVNYQNGKIYKIVCNITGKVYVGSTTKEYLSQRLVEHRKKYKAYSKTGLLKKSSVEVLENGDYSIILLANCPCDTKDELLMTERNFMEESVCVNKKLPIQFEEERKEYLANHKLKNKEKAKEQYKIRYEKVKLEREQKLIET